MTESPILLQRDGAIARLTLNRPDRLNALTLAMLGELSAALSDLDGDERYAAVILTGTGRGFCAGQDLTDHEAVDDTRAIRAVVERHYNPVIRQIRALPQPVIAAVNGIAAGARLLAGAGLRHRDRTESAEVQQRLRQHRPHPRLRRQLFLPRRWAARALGLSLLGERSMRRPPPNGA